MTLWSALFLFTIITNTISQDPSCDYSQTLKAGQTYFVYSPNYPRNYTGGAQCRWIANCPSGYNCRLTCDEINLPQTPSCSMDRLLVSKTGDPQLSAADFYCGRGTLNVLSSGQRISVGLISSKYSPGGRIMCKLTAQPISPPPPSCSCGYKKTNRIVGGEETGVNEFPMMAAIADARIAQIKCGGVILDKRYVLTAAHCLQNQKVNNVAVVVGEHNVNVADSPATQGIRAVRFIIHPLYSNRTFDYDIGIIVLAKDIVFSDRVGPVCLPFKFVSSSFAGASVTALGWGTQSFGGPSSDYLQKVNLTVISQSSCRSQVKDLTDREMCTYTPGKDSCQDDSGGPLLYTDPATGLLFSTGIISHGSSCAASTPAVNTRLTSLLQWVIDNTPLAKYCVK